MGTPSTRTCQDDMRREPCTRVPVDEEFATALLAAKSPKSQCYTVPESGSESDGNAHAAHRDTVGSGIGSHPVEDTYTYTFTKPASPLSFSRQGSKSYKLLQQATSVEDFVAALSVVRQSISTKTKKPQYKPADSGSEHSSSDSDDTFGGYPVGDIYSHTWTTPFGMKWKTTKTDKQNLYVSKVAPDSQAMEGGVLKGSKLLSFNGQLVENLGSKEIYSRLAQASLPLTITFLKPDAAKRADRHNDQDGTPEPPQAPKHSSPSVESPRALMNTAAAPAPAPNPTDYSDDAPDSLSRAITGTPSQAQHLLNSPPGHSGDSLR